MDGNLTPPSQPSGTTAQSLSSSGAMPADAPLDMPAQLREHAPPVASLDTLLVTWLARAIATIATLGFFGYGLREMIATVGFSNMTSLQAAMMVFFAITLLWIAFSAGSAICGLLTPRSRGARAPADGSRTALVMPVYNEDPLRTTAALQAMAEALAGIDAARHFEIVIISDSTNADAWIIETLAAQRLRTALAHIMPVRYRRRWHNVGRKVGNVEDFVKRWGGHYDYMIVLDADSIMAPDTLVTLVERMQADARLGILQTVPALIGQMSFFARLQQFASCMYGGVIARGMEAWSGNEGNYWGHNAIIRVRAFAAACGLPQLPGRKPFGGFVLSHDFIEAAYIRRAGWKVQMAADLGGSWEDGPPSLTDIAVRDRRWAQGNLQHIKLIGSKGLTSTNRLHIAVGIMSYLASPLWLMLILIGFALTLQATLIRPEYFSRTFQLFPDWPLFDARRMMLLFLFSMIVLLIPKMIGLVRGWLIPSVRRNCGGFLGVPVSAVVELAISALYAPVMMLIQTQHVFSILTGRDSEWTTQRRQAEVMSWRESTRFHWKHTLTGVALGIIAFLLSPTLLAWLSPTVAGLVLAIPLSKFSGSVRLGEAFSHLGLFRIPEEHAAPALLRRRDEIMHGAEPLPADGLRYLARHPVERAAHITGNLARPSELRGHPNTHRLTAAAKVLQAHNLREALGWLSAPERIEVAADRELLEHLGQLPQIEAVG